ncbi:MAG: hypothetical protein HYR56_17725 [Acidobacteria bacterium]|nr:hypothetical protein [Acidobacteriota bacterium]MBI3424204.1 hypothetical protein [Acidobacteriota bacterium]
MPAKRSTHARAAHARAMRYSTLTLCFILILAGLPFDARVKGQNNPNANQDGPRTKGAPGPNLPNLDQTKAAGARDEMQPEVILPPPVAATRCRMRDRLCKETKEKKIGLAPHYEQFRGLWARVFDWQAKPDSRRLPAVEALLAPRRGEQLDVTPASYAAINQAPRRDKTAKSLPRAYASSFFPAAVQGATNWETARVDEINRTGTGGEDLYSGNYNWNLPLVSLPGRAGHDLNLTLSYNSLVWLRLGTQMRFDHDWSWPSAGFHLGFPTFQGPYLNTQTNLISYQMFTPTGRVVELRANGTNTYDARDGSLTRLTFNGSGYPVLTTTDGTTYTYGATLDIKDRNGNLITVSYNAAGLYSTITDTLGRVVTFNYGAYNDLQTITQSWDNLTKTLVTFSYDNSFQLYPAFSGLTLENVTSGQYEPVLYQINFLDGTRFNFQYNTYGQVTRIERRGANSNLRNWIAYDLPASGGAPTDCPRFTKRTDWAVDWSPTAGYDTNFCFSDTTCPWTASHLVGKVTTPDGTTQRVVFADYTPSNNAWKRGLTVLTETWSGGIKKKWTTLSWENTGTLYQLNPRVNETNIYDEANNRRRTYIEYWDYTYNLPSYVTEYNADATTVLRQTLTFYNVNGQYLSRRLIGLPTERALYDGSGALQAKVQYVYDEAGYLQAHPTLPIRHDSTGSGNSSAGNYGLTFSYRGNVTTLRRYNVTDSSYVENKTGYYITGNPAYTKNPRDLQNIPQTQTTFTYNGTYLTDAGYPETRPNTYAYLGSSTDPDGFTSTIEYHFDRGDVRRTTDPKGAIVRRDYDGMGRMWKVLNETNGAYTRYTFDPNHNFVQSYSTINDATEFYSITTFDGHGRTRASASDHPGSTTGYKGQYTGYDNMGRVYQQSNPAEMNGSTWNPAGDDVAGWAWSYQTYDWKSRPLVTTNQDTTTRTISYAGCGCAGGQVETICDEGDGVLVSGQPRRHKQVVYHDVLGRVTKTQVLNWDASVYSTTINTYNVRDQIATVKEYSGNATGTEACPSATCQKTDLSYDGHGRLYQRKLPIESAPTTYSYFADDTVQTMTDARGASSTYGYNNRQLVTSITYGVPAGVGATPNVTIGYDAAGNRTSMSDGPGNVAYIYDTLSRLQSETRTFNGLATTYQLSYVYNLAGELKSISTSTGQTVNYQFDKAGRLSGATPSGFAGVTQLVSGLSYRAWGGLKHLNYGNGLSKDLGYSIRMEVSQFNMPGKLSLTYNYQNDGRVQTALDNFVGNYNRSFSYDHEGRLTASSNTIFNHTYQFDVWSNMNGRYNANSNPQNYTATYVNNRNTAAAWQYDAAGNVTLHDGVQSDYDARNAITKISKGAGTARKEYFYDGNGQEVKWSAILQRAASSAPSARCARPS